MKLCTVWGDLTSDKASEQYPQENVCDACVEGYMEADDPHIVTVNGEYDSSYGDTCYFCEKSFEYEQEELRE